MTSMPGRAKVQICRLISRVGAQRLLVADGGHVVFKIVINPVCFAFLRGRGKSRQHTGETSQMQLRAQQPVFLHA